VAAAMLSQRYITDRFLPDKAIDLIDESAAGLRMEIDSLPTEIDEIERRIMQLEIERQALRKETDVHSRERLTEIEKELATLREQSDGLKAHWQTEKPVSYTHLDVYKRQSCSPSRLQRDQPSRPEAAPARRLPHYMLLLLPCE